MADENKIETVFYALRHFTICAHKILSDLSDFNLCGYRYNGRIVQGLDFNLKQISLVLRMKRFVLN